MPSPHSLPARVLVTLLLSLALVPSAYPAPLPYSEDNSSPETNDGDVDAPDGSANFPSRSPRLTRVGSGPASPSSQASTSSIGVGAEAGANENTSTTWTLNPHFDNLSPFNVTSTPIGATNLVVLSGSPSSTFNSSTIFTTSSWNDTLNSLQVNYPAYELGPTDPPTSSNTGASVAAAAYTAGKSTAAGGSTEPASASSRVGGAEFYAHPLDLSGSKNVTLEYSVYFPADFDFVKGGQLPGIYGGLTGEVAAGVGKRDLRHEHVDHGDFSTRMMWREGGLGELYLRAPSRYQTRRLCSTPPYSHCGLEYPYSMSIGRGAFRFARGGWTKIRQDVWLDTPGRNDGGINVWIDGRLVLHAHDIMYREHRRRRKVIAIPAPAPPAAAPPPPPPMDDTPPPVDPTPEEPPAEDPPADDPTPDADAETDAPADERRKKRKRMDDGHWKGYPGYPGDPGFQSAPPAPGVPVTVTVTPPAVTITKTVSTTVTVTPPAKKPAPPKPPAKKPAKKPRAGAVLPFPPGSMTNDPLMNQAVLQLALVSGGASTAPAYVSKTYPSGSALSSPSPSPSSSSAPSTLSGSLPLSGAPVSPSAPSITGPTRDASDDDDDDDDVEQASLTGMVFASFFGSDDLSASSTSAREIMPKTEQHAYFRDFKMNINQ